MDTKKDVERLVAKHGEPYRRLITDALKWLDENEPKWESVVLDRDKFISELITHVYR